ncbi:MAG: AI-2E family transporter [Dehalococcoidia bacterium]
MLTNRRLRTILALGVTAIVLWFLWQARIALLPFIIGGILAFLLAPLVNLLARAISFNRLSESTSRLLAVILLYGVVLVTLSVLAVLFVPPMVSNLQELIEDREDIYERASVQLAEALDFYERTVPEFIKVEVAAALQNLGDQAGARVTSMLQGVLSVLADSFSVALGFLVIPVFLFYVLKDQHRASQSFYGLFPESVRDDARNITASASRLLGSYVRVQLILGVIVGVLSWIGLELIGVPYALPLALILGFTELIPTLGPLIGGAIVVLVTLAVDPGLAVLWVLLLVVGIQQLENIFLVPRLQGTAVNIHPALVMIILVMAGYQFGLLGLLIALPVIAVLRNTFVYIYQRLDEGSAHEDPPPPSTPATAQDRGLDY